MGRVGFEPTTSGKPALLTNLSTDPKVAYYMQIFFFFEKKIFENKFTQIVKVGRNIFNRIFSRDINTYLNAFIFK